MVEIVIVGNMESVDANAVLKYIYHSPSYPIVVANKREDNANLLKSFKGKQRLGGRTSFYVCLDHKCLLPTSSKDIAVRQIKAIYTNAPVL